MLKVKEVKHFEVRWKDLNNFVKETYKVDYCFIEREECGNDSIHEFHDVDGIDFSREFISAKDMFNGLYTNFDVLNLLCRDGHIEKGNYLIDVCW